MSSLGFSYTVTRLRGDSSLRRIVDISTNFLNTVYPADTLYNWNAEIDSGVEHTVKVFSPSGIMHSVLTLSKVGVRWLEVYENIGTAAPLYGVGDEYQVYRKNPITGVLDLLKTGKVTDYTARSDKTFGLIFDIVSSSGVPRDLFLVHYTTTLNDDLEFKWSTPNFLRVLEPSEIYKYPKFGNLNPNKLGAQYICHPTFYGVYKTEEDLLAGESAIIGNLIILSKKLHIIDQRTRLPLQLVQSSGTIQVGHSVNLLALYSEGNSTFTLVQNSSGGFITPNGKYTAGNTSGVDIVRVTDASQRTFEATFNVVDTFSTTFNGEFKWQLIQ